MNKLSMRRVLSAGPTPFVALAIVVAAAVLCLRYVVTAPPHRLVIATDSDDGYFTRTARIYATRFAAQGVTLEIVSTHGATDNLERINAKGSKVDVAFTHGGLTDVKRSPDLESLGSVAYEPLWIVHNAALGELDGIPKLRGRTIGIGRKGSGTEAIARRVLTASGVTDENSHIIMSDDDASSEALATRNGSLDAMFVMGPPEDERIRALFADEKLRVMSLSDAEGLSRNLPFLHALTVPKSTVDLARQEPDRDLSVVASTITLVARKEVHPAIIYLLMSIVDDVHEPPSLLHKENEFPSDKDTDLPLSPQAETYYRSGKPFLQRYLPFGLASAVERLFKVAVPIGLVVFPFLRALPAFYQWRVKRKLARSYRELLEVERGVSAPGARLTLDEYEQRLLAIEQRIREANIPLLYSNELYVLREHIELARRQIANVINARDRSSRDLSQPLSRPS